MAVVVIDTSSVEGLACGVEVRRQRRMILDTTTLAVDTCASSKAIGIPENCRPEEGRWG